MITSITVGTNALVRTWREEWCDSAGLHTANAGMSSHVHFIVHGTETGRGAALPLHFIILLSLEVQLGLKPSSQCAFWLSCSLQTNSTRLIINLLLSNHGRPCQHTAAQLQCNHTRRARDPNVLRLLVLTRVGWK